MPPPRRVRPSQASPNSAPQWRSEARRHRWWLAGLLATGIATAVTWTLWPDPQQPPPRARQYLEFTACLLTGEKGLAEPTAIPVWAGMQDASLATRAKVQYLAITGPQTVDNGETFVATLAQTHCNLIFAAGDTPVASVNSAATKFPTTTFLVISATNTHANVSTVEGRTAEEIQASVNRLITAKFPKN